MQSGLRPSPRTCPRRELAVRENQVSVLDMDQVLKPGGFLVPQDQIRDDERTPFQLDQRGSVAPSGGDHEGGSPGIAASTLISSRIPRGSLTGVKR